MEDLCLHLREVFRVRSRLHLLLSPPSCFYIDAIFLHGLGVRLVRFALQFGEILAHCSRESFAIGGQNLVEDGFCGHRQADHHSARSGRAFQLSRLILVQVHVGASTTRLRQYGAQPIPRRTRRAAGGEGSGRSQKHLLAAVENGRLRVRRRAGEVRLLRHGQLREPVTVVFELG